MAFLSCHISNGIIFARYATHRSYSTKFGLGRGGGGKGGKSPPSNGLAHVEGVLAFTFHPGEKYLCLTTNKMSGYTQNI